MILKRKTATPTPFRAQFGTKPSGYIERDDLKNQLTRALDDDNSEWNSTLITGASGSGKTSFLIDFYEELQYEDDIIPIYLSNVDNQNDLPDGLLFALCETIGHSRLNFKHLQLKAGFFSVQMDSNDEFAGNFSQVTSNILRHLNIKRDVLNHHKLVVIIDEAQAKFD